MATVPKKEAKPRVIWEDSREYRKREREMKELYAPALIRCNRCGSPRHQSYICQYCGHG